MSARGLFAAFAALSGVGASLILPMTSKAQLAETMAATSIHGQVATMQKSNLLTPGKRARAVASKAQPDRIWEQQTEQGRGVSANSKGVDSAEVVAFDEKSPVKGKTYLADGVVLSDSEISGQRVVLVLKVQSDNRFLVMGFRLHDPKLPTIPENTPVRVAGVYASKFKDPKTGTWLHGFDDAVFENAAVANAQPQGEQASPEKEEKPTFASLLKGWEFRGTVQANGEATGVFVNGENVRYAKPGTELDTDVKVTQVSGGQARVVVEGRRIDLTPW